MGKNESVRYNDLFSSLISQIKSYSRKVPLIPWLRVIKKMKVSLSPQMLNEKLPRFLQKCAESFESDRRYRDDARYIRVWLQLITLILAEGMGSASANDQEPYLSHFWQNTMPSTTASTVFRDG